LFTAFYRAHKPATYARWAASVPGDFQFAVKVPKQVTHVSHLTDVTTLNQFLAQVSGLGDKLGPLLVQLPPSLVFDAQKVRAFFNALRESWAGHVACEPRHKSWFTFDADQLLAKFRVARVAADPAPVPAAAQPGGWNGLVYLRLHGSPRIYYSAYPVERLQVLAQVLKEKARSASVWCIFNNTAQGAATADGLTLLRCLNKT
jgi:uncharacterized protein YecE (DUF72 family)